MLHLFQPYALLLLTAVAISAALALMILRHRPTLGSHSFALLMGAISLWALLNFFEVIAEDLAVKQFSGRLKYLFIVTVPVTWFAFSLYYSNRIRHLRWAHLALLSIVPVMTLVMIATNDMHHLMFQSIEWRRSHNMLLPLRQFGLWFWVHTVYSYLLMFLGFLFLAKACVDMQRIFRSQAISLLIAVIAPWLCNILFLSGAHPLPHLDLTPFAFTISGLAVMWGIVRYRLLEIIPVARDIVIQNMQDGIVVLDNRDRIVDVNPAAAQWAGRSQQALIGSHAEQAISWWPGLPDKRKTAESHRPPALIEIQHGSRPRQLQLSVSELHAKGKSIGLLVILRDVTDLRSTQEAMRRSEDRFKAISENAPVIILALNDTANITYVNPTWQNILGHERGEVIGQPFHRFVIEDCLLCFDDIFDRLINGSERVAEGHVAFRHKNDSRRTFDFTASVNSDGEGRITGIIFVAKDVTEEDRLKAQLFQSQKMEAIGTLAGGIAHDFNNLLMGMQANISLLQLEYETQASLQEKLKRIEDQIFCGASLTRQLLGYARKGKYVVAPINVHTLLEEALQVVQRTHKNLRVHRFFDADPSILEADQGQMELVFLNLFVNAADAMPAGGDLTLSTRVAPHAELSAHWPDIRPGQYIEIKVADTGTGMDQGTLERIFEPFFTTKDIGRGTGLGLASVYGVVKNHYGHIRVDSQPGKGSTFTLLFQAAPVARMPAETLQPPVPAVSQGGHILLVDDEPNILTYIGEMIQSLGFFVLPAEDGPEAVRLFEKNHQVIDAVILDMYLPGMNGWEIFRRLRAIDPKVRVIIASGYGLNEMSERILQQGRHVLLAKPFTRDELAHAVNKLLGSAEGALRFRSMGNRCENVMKN